MSKRTVELKRKVRRMLEVRGLGWIRAACMSCMFVCMMSKLLQVMWSLIDSQEEYV